MTRIARRQQADGEAFASGVLLLFSRTPASFLKDTKDRRRRAIVGEFEQDLNPPPDALSSLVTCKFKDSRVIH